MSARLVDEPVNRETSPQPSSIGTTVTEYDEDIDLRVRELETRYYHELVNDGGRPSHPIGLDYDIAKDLKEYCEILSFWATPPAYGYDRMVFDGQLCEWRRFREYQRYKREQGRFSPYCQRLHDRLARHGFDRSFQLHEERDRQDQLATWIEFLNYEYVKYDRDAGVVSRQQSQHDDAWKKLVHSGVLYPSETEEILWNFTLQFQMSDEESEAQNAASSAASTVELADQALQKAQQAGLSRRSLSQMKEMLSVVKSKLAAATNSLEQISLRRKLIVEFKKKTKSYHFAEKEIREQRKLLYWILQQVPLIELELNPAGVAGSDSAQVNSRPRRNLKRNRSDDGRNGEPGTKRRRQDDENHVLSESQLRETSSAQRPRQLRSSHTNPGTLALKRSSPRTLGAPRPSNTKRGSSKSSVLVDDNVRVKKRRQSKLGGTPDFRVLRRSSRLKRPPERFQ